MSDSTARAERSEEWCRFKKGDIVTTSISEVTKGRRFEVTRVRLDGSRWMVTAKLLGTHYWPLESICSLHEDWFEKVTP